MNLSIQRLLHLIYINVGLYIWLKGNALPDIAEKKEREHIGRIERVAEKESKIELNKQRRHWRVEYISGLASQLLAKFPKLPPYYEYKGLIDLHLQIFEKFAFCATWENHLGRLIWVDLWQVKLLISSFRGIEVWFIERGIVKEIPTDGRGILIEVELTFCSRRPNRWCESFTVLFLNLIIMWINGLVWQGVF